MVVYCMNEYYTFSKINLTCLVGRVAYIYVWIYENGAKELYPYNPYFTWISLNSKAASQPCKRA